MHYEIAEVARAVIHTLFDRGETFGCPPALVSAAATAPAATVSAAAVVALSTAAAAADMPEEVVSAPHSVGRSRHSVGRSRRPDRAAPFGTPLTTVIPEEFAFWGVLHGALNQGGEFIAGATSTA